MTGLVFGGGPWHNLALTPPTPMMAAALSPNISRRVDFGWDARDRFAVTEHGGTFITQERGGSIVARLGIRSLARHSEDDGRLNPLEHLVDGSGELEDYRVSYRMEGKIVSTRAMAEGPSCRFPYPRIFGRRLRWTPTCSLIGMGTSMIATGMMQVHASKASQPKPAKDLGAPSREVSPSAGWGAEEEHATPSAASPLSKIDRYGHGGSTPLVSPPIPCSRAHEFPRH
jgi:hypothetical protein